MAGRVWAAVAMVGEMYRASLWLASLIFLLWDVCMIVGMQQGHAATKRAALDARLSTGLFGITVRLHV